MAKGTISILATIPPIQAAFKYLDGGGARVALDLDPKSAQKYFAFLQVANRGLFHVTGELGLVSDGKKVGKVLTPKFVNTGPR